MVVVAVDAGGNESLGEQGDELVADAGDDRFGEVGAVGWDLDRGDGSLWRPAGLDRLVGLEVPFDDRRSVPGP